MLTAEKAGMSFFTVADEERRRRRLDQPMQTPTTPAAPSEDEPVIVVPIEKTQIGDDCPFPSNEHVQYLDMQELKVGPSGAMALWYIDESAKESSENALWKEDLPSVYACLEGKITGVGRLLYRTEGEVSPAEDQRPVPSGAIYSTP